MNIEDMSMQYRSSGNSVAPAATVGVEHVNSVNCIKGEVHAILTLIRLHTRWSTPASSYRKSKAAMDDDESCVADEDPLLQSFRRLNEYVSMRYDLQEVDCVIYLLPFYQVIVSDKASGPLTSCALSSLSKFMLYGFLSPDRPRAAEGVALVAKAISFCVFEETDWESDELILMKLLELSTLCYHSEASILLSTASAWDIFSTCTSIHGHYRASKILRSEAENALINVTLSIFSRATHIVQASGADELQMQLQLLFEKGSKWDEIKEQYNLATPTGLVVLMWKIMSVLSDMADVQQQTPGQNSSLQFALQLVNVALEAGGIALSDIKPLALILGNDICRHLLRISQSDDLTVLSLALRVVLNLFTVTKQNMKVQLEVFLISVHLRLIQISGGNSSSSAIAGTGTVNTASSAAATLSAAKEELALESLLEFCREPALMADIYANYDCDVQCTNLFQSIMSTLCQRAIPSRLHRMGFTSLSVQQQEQRSEKKQADVLVNESTPSTPSLPKSPSTGLFISPAVRSSSSNSVTAGLFGTSVDIKAPITTRSAHAMATGVGGSIVGIEYVKLSIVNRLALDGILAVLNSIAVRCTRHVQYIDKGNGCGYRTTEPVSDVGPHPKPDSVSSEQINHVSVADVESNDDNSMYDVVSVNSVGRSSAVVDGPPSSQLSLHNPADIEPDAQKKSRKGSGGGENVDASAQSITSQEATPVPATTCSTMDESIPGDPKGGSKELLLLRAQRAAMLRREKVRKQKIKLVAESFNRKPLKSEWVLLAIDMQLLNPPKQDHHSTIDQHETTGAVEGPGGVTAAAVAKFLKTTPLLGKTEVGEYISKGPADLFPFNAAVLHEYVKTFDFTGKNAAFDCALRMFLGSFKMPGEAQCIDRLMEAFAARLFQYLGPGRPFASQDAAFILSFSTIMLNTDLHNPHIPPNKKMTKAQFIRNNRGINDGDDIPQNYLENLYDEIKARQIQVDVDLNDTLHSMDFADTNMWHILLERATAEQAPPVFTPSASATNRKHKVVKSMNSAINASTSTEQVLQNNEDKEEEDCDPFSKTATEQRLDGGLCDPATIAEEPSFHEREMFLTISSLSLEALILLWEQAADDYLISRIYQGLWDYITVCIKLGLSGLLSRTVELLIYRARLMMSTSRALPSQPYSGANVLADRSAFKQWKHDTGHDLLGLMTTEFDDMVKDHLNESVSAAQCVRDTPVVKQSAVWMESSMVKGELLVKISLQTAIRCPGALSTPAWSTVISLLLWARSRGVLPVALSLTNNDLIDYNYQSREPMDNIGITSKELMPTVFARECFLRAYGLVFESMHFNGKRQRMENGGQYQNNLFADRSSNSLTAPIVSRSGSYDIDGKGGSSSWMSSIGGFIWSATANPIESNPLSAQAASSHAASQLYARQQQQRQGSLFGGGTGINSSMFLEVPDIYRNLNAGLLVDVHGNPVRPDDELLKVCLRSSHPDEIFYLALSDETKTGDRNCIALDDEFAMHSHTNDVLTSLMRSLIGKFAMTINKLSIRGVKLITADSKMFQDQWDKVAIERRQARANSSTLGTADDASISSIGFGDDDASSDAALLTGTAGLDVEVDNAIFPDFLLGDEDDMDTFVEQLIRRHKNEDNQQQRNLVSGVMSNSTAAGLELDCVTILEWVSMMIFSSHQNLRKYWKPIFEYLRLILDDSVDVFAVQCPYLLERCVFTILRAAIIVVGDADSMRGQQQSEDTEHVWDSLKLLRSFPTDFIHNVSDQIAFALFEIIRKCASNDSVRPAVEQWYLLFSILNVAADGRSGREYVWIAIDHLISCDLLSEANFLPVRQLLIRFIENSFPDVVVPPSAKASSTPVAQGISGDEAKQGHDLQSRSGGGNVRPVKRRSYSLLAMTHLLRLTCMALAGHLKNSDEGIVLSSSSESNSDTGELKKVFPLPAAYGESHPMLEGSYAGKQADKTTASDATAASSSSSLLGPTSFTVKPVKLPQQEDTELIWLENGKIFANMCNSSYLKTSIRATFCLKALVMAANTVTVSSDLWVHMLNELVERLPVSLITAGNRLGLSPATNSVEIMQCCQRSCSVIFDIFITHVADLRSRRDFRAIWVRFVSVLSTNAQATHRGAVHDDTCGMLESLLRLLRKPTAESYVNLQSDTADAMTAFISSERPTATSRINEQYHQSGSVPSNGSGGSGGSIGGFFTWLVGSEQNAISSSSQNRSELKNKNVETVTVANHSELIDGTVSESREENIIRTIDDAKTVDAHDHDGPLLLQSWKTICSLYPAFPSYLKNHNLQLMHTISNAIVLEEKAQAQVQQIADRAARYVRGIPTPPSAVTPARKARDCDVIETTHTQSTSNDDTTSSSVPSVASPIPLITDLPHVEESENQEKDVDDKLRTDVDSKSFKVEGAQSNTCIEAKQSIADAMLHSDNRQASLSSAAFSAAMSLSGVVSTPVGSHSVDNDQLSEPRQDILTVKSGDKSIPPISKNYEIVEKIPAIEKDASNAKQQGSSIRQGRTMNNSNTKEQSKMTKRTPASTRSTKGRSISSLVQIV